MTTTTKTAITTVGNAEIEVLGTGAKKQATRAEMEVRRTSLLEIAREAQPASVRHIYYRAVVAGIVEKKQTGYRKVQRQILEMRRAGIIPFNWITDEGRRAHWPIVDSSPTTALRYLASTYRRDPWQFEGAPKVEIWTESESIAGVLMPLKTDFSVPIFPLKGQGSETFVWSSASSYQPGQKVVVLYAGDYDPAGLQIGSQLAGKLREYASKSVEIDFRRVTIDDEQAEALQALGTPPKQHHWIDYHGTRHDFPGQAIEAEAVDPKVMRRLFSGIVENLAFGVAGYDVFAESKAIEQDDRERLAHLARGWSS